MYAHLGSPGDPKGSLENILGTFHGTAGVHLGPPRDAWGVLGARLGTHWPQWSAKGSPWSCRRVFHLYLRGADLHYRCTLYASVPPCTYLGGECSHFWEPLGLPPRDLKGSLPRTLWGFPEDLPGTQGAPQGTHWRSAMVCQGPRGPHTNRLGAPSSPWSCHRPFHFYSRGAT